VLSHLKPEHQIRVIILGELLPKSYLILELATNTLRIFKENWMKIAKIILEKY
jgi:hypothetical protein